MISKIFPLLDFLYIFDALNYNRIKFLKWFLTHPLKRNLQGDKGLNFTFKIQLLAILTSFIMLSLAVLISLIFFKGNLWILILIYIIFESISPIFIIISSFFLLPYELYLKLRR